MLHELPIHVIKVRFQLDRHACLTVPVAVPQSVNICQVTEWYSRAASTRLVRLSLYATPTSRSLLRRLYLTLSSKEVSRHVQAPHFISIHTYHLSSTHRAQTPHIASVTRDVADVVSDSARYARHRATSPTSRPTRRRSRNTATTVDHGDAALYQRRCLAATTCDTTRPHTNAAASPRRDGSRSSCDTRRHYSTSTQLRYLLSADKIC